MATNNLGLEQPAYLSDGEIAVGQVNLNFAVIDALIDTIITHDGDIVTSDGNVVVTIK